MKMGNISIMARRLDGGMYVQYGYSGNGGYFNNTGARLLEWYDDPDKVEYLFELGQTKLIGKPGSENGGESWFVSHDLENQPCWIGKSERVIFSKIAFIDHGYFYDLDNTWYYIIPGPFRIKIPLEHIANNLDEHNYEFDYLEKIENYLMTYIFGRYINENKDFHDFFYDNISSESENTITSEEFLDKLLKDSSPIEKLFRQYNRIFEYFDDWVVVVPKDDKLQFKVRKKDKNHIETINW